MSSDTPQVAKVPMFDGLTDTELDQIAKAGTKVTVPEHWSLIWEKTPADKAYLIVSGEVSVRKSGQEIARLGAGDVIGEMAIVEHKLRSASVVSLTPLEVIHFTDDAIQRIREAVPAFDEALRQTAAERLGSTGD